MSRITCKICRRLGFSVCGGEKCALNRKPYPPGIHGRRQIGSRRRSFSEYGVQLKEKQKVKFLYGMRERQFRNLISEATSVKSAGAQNRIVERLETRLDNVVYRLGFAKSRSAARQIVGHGHIQVDGENTTIPSRSLKVGQIISIRPQSSGKAVFRDLDLRLKKHEIPSWLEMTLEKHEGRLKSMPSVEEASIGANLNAVIEFYAR